MFVTIVTIVLCYKFCATKLCLQYHEISTERDLAPREQVATRAIIQSNVA